MITCEAKDSLSCLINLDSSLELLPEPFRMQRLVLKLSYAAYMKYIGKVQDESELMLVDGLQIRKDWLFLSSPKLYDYYLLDLACAIMKELSFAERYDSYATVIVPTSDKETLLTEADINSAFPALLARATELRNVMKSYGFVLPQQISKQNMLQYKLAVVLYGASRGTAPTREFGVELKQFM